ncbi:MAG: DUF2807 domain-containing protein [Vicingaceae bacterium]|nr:DUF2807 domain-containing protein [Vicingaceae bacterium]
MVFKRILFLIVLAFSFYSCVNSIDGDGNVTTEERSTDSFNKIDISGHFEVFINQGNTEKLEIEADYNLIELIETETKSNTLYIKSKKPIGNAESLKLYITVKNITDIDISGAVELNSKGTLDGENLEINISGAADINLGVDVISLTMDMSGASETTLRGKAENFDIELSGASDLQAEKLKTKHTSVDISGAGSAKVFAKKTLKVEVSGAGSVKYKGNPKITKVISGAGSVTKL